MSVLDGRINEFIAADFDTQEEIVEEILEDFGRTHPEGKEFDKTVVGNVSAPSAAFVCSNTFLAYSPEIFRKKHT